MAQYHHPAPLPGRDGYTVLYRPAPKLFRDLMIARGEGSLGRVLETIARTDVLVVDDFAMAPLSASGKSNWDWSTERYSCRRPVPVVTFLRRKVSRENQVRPSRLGGNLLRWRHRE